MEAGPQGTHRIAKKNKKTENDGGKEADPQKDWLREAKKSENEIGKEINEGKGLLRKMENDRSAFFSKAFANKVTKSIEKMELSQHTLQKKQAQAIEADQKHFSQKKAYPDPASIISAAMTDFRDNYKSTLKKHFG